MSGACKHRWERRIFEWEGVLFWWDTRCLKCLTLYERGDMRRVDELPGESDYLSGLGDSPPPRLDT